MLLGAEQLAVTALSGDTNDQVLPVDALQNYMSISAPDGISVGEKIK